MSLQNQNIPPIIVQDASDSESEDEKFKSVWRNRQPSPGEWMEPIEIDSFDTATVAASSMTAFTTTTKARGVQQSNPGSIIGDDPPPTRISGEASSTPDETIIMTTTPPTKTTATRIAIAAEPSKEEMMMMMQCCICNHPLPDDRPYYGCKRSAAASAGDGRTHYRCTNCELVYLRVELSPGHAFDSQRYMGGNVSSTVISQPGQLPCPQFILGNCSCAALSFAGLCHTLQTNEDIAELYQTALCHAAEAQIKQEQEQQRQSSAVTSASAEGGSSSSSLAAPQTKANYYWKKMGRSLRYEARAMGRTIRRATNETKKVLGIGIGTIQIETYAMHYMMGDTLRGNVRLELPEPTHASRLVIQIRAVREEEEDRDTKDIFRNGKTLYQFELQLGDERTYKCAEPVFEFSFLIPKQIEPEFQLSEELSGSTIGRVLSMAGAVHDTVRSVMVTPFIQWTLSAYLEIPWRANLTEVGSISVGRH